MLRTKKNNFLIRFINCKRFILMVFRRRDYTVMNIYKKQKGGRVILLESEGVFKGGGALDAK